MYTAVATTVGCFDETTLAESECSAQPPPGSLYSPSAALAAGVEAVALCGLLQGSSAHFSTAHDWWVSRAC